MYTLGIAFQWEIKETKIVKVLIVMGNKLFLIRIIIQMCIFI